MPCLRATFDEAFQLVTKGGTGMGWRNNKNWKEHIPVLDAAGVEIWKNAINAGDVFVTLNPDIDITAEQLYGGTRDTHTAMFDVLKTAQDRCVKAAYVKNIDTGSKGTLLLVVDQLGQFDVRWAIPECDVHLASLEAVKEVQDVIEERRRIAALKTDLKCLSRRCSDTQNEHRDRAMNLLSNINSVAECAYGSASKAAPQMSDVNIENLLKTWDKVEVMQGEASVHMDKLMLRVTKNNIVMKYNREGTRGVHASLDGIKVNIGKIMIELGYKGRTIIPGSLTEYRFTWNLYGNVPNKTCGFLHPHIQKCGSTEHMGMFMGSCCLGSYSGALDAKNKSSDVYGVLEIMYDYLTSCSESGWYIAFHPWLTEEVRNQYCSCLKMRFDEKNIKCSSCGGVSPLTAEARIEGIATIGGIRA